MATYQEMVEKYRKRQRDTLVDTLTAGLNYVDDLAVDLGLMEDSGVLGDMMDTVGCALPFALIAVTEQCKVIMGKKDQRAAAENTVYRMAKTGAAMGVGALAFAAGGAVAAIPAAMGTRALLDKYKSKALLTVRVENRTRRLQALRRQMDDRRTGRVTDDGLLLPGDVERLPEAWQRMERQSENEEGSNLSAS